MEVARQKLVKRLLKQAERIIPRCTSHQRCLGVLLVGEGEEPRREAVGEAPHRLVEEEGEMQMQLGQRELVVVGLPSIAGTFACTLHTLHTPRTDQHQLPRCRSTACIARTERRSQPGSLLWECWPLVQEMPKRLPEGQGSCCNYDFGCGCCYGDCDCRGCMLDHGMNRHHLDRRRSHHHHHFRRCNVAGEEADS